MTENADDTALDHPERIGSYRILDVLGEGGMAVVYLAEQSEPVKRRVALKVVKPGMDSKQVVARFESERQALAVLDHPNIAKIFEGGVTESGRPYFAMELVHGVPITEFCDDHRLNTKERLALMVTICSAIQHAHHKGLIHRDLKPSNLLVAVGDDHPEVKVIDFGIAKATSTPLTEQTLVTRLGQVIGTPQYMSPEQAGITGLDVDTRADVYSLGVVLYELLVGVVPLDLGAIGDEAMRVALLEREPTKPSTRITELGETKEEIARARATSPDRLRNQLKGDLDWIALKAMEKERTRRYATVNALGLDLMRYLDNEPVSAVSPSVGYRMRKFLRRHRFGVASAAAIAAALMAGSVLATIGMLRAQEAQSQAEIDARTAERTADFLVSLFTESDPHTALGRELTARDILTVGADRIHVELAGQPPVQARLMRTIGMVYINLGEYGEARPLLEEALAVRESALGADHADTADSLVWLAELDRLDGDVEMAETRFRRALGILRGSMTQDEIMALGGIGMLMQRNSDYAAAEPLFREALDLQIRVNGERHESIPNAMNDLASLLHDQGKYDEAGDYYHRAVTLGRELHGDTHPDLAAYVNNLASLLQEQGDLEGAEALFVESLEMRQRLYGDSHPAIARAMNNLARVRRDLGDNDGAIEMHRQALEMRRDVFGNDHTEVAQSFNNLGAMMFDANRNAEALDLYREALRIWSGALGDGHPRVNVTRSTIATLLIREGRYEEAEEIARRAVESFDPELADEHLFYHIARFRFADALYRTGNFDEAEPILLGTIQHLRARYGDTSRHTQAAFRVAVAMYEARDDSDSARTYRELLIDE